MCVMADLDSLFKSDEYLAPEPLTVLCFKLICHNLDVISFKVCNRRKLHQSLVLPSGICDRLIEFIQRSESNEDINNVLSIFDNLKSTKLKNLKISRCLVEDATLKFLLNHKLMYLEISDCPQLTNHILEYINNNSENLYNLAIHRCSSICSSDLHCENQSFYLTLFGCMYIVIKIVPFRCRFEDVPSKKMCISCS